MRKAKTKALGIGTAAVIVLAGLAAAASPAAGHTKSDTREFRGTCNAGQVACVTPVEDVTGGQVCSSGTCWVGGVWWTKPTLQQINDGQNIDTIRATVHSTVNPAGIVLCLMEDAPTVPDLATTANCDRWASGCESVEPLHTFGLERAVVFVGPVVSDHACGGGFLGHAPLVGNGDVTITVSDPH